MGLGSGNIVGSGQAGVIGAYESCTRMLGASVSTEKLFVSRTSPQTSSASSRSAAVRPGGSFEETYTLTASQLSSLSLVLNPVTLQ